MKVDYVYKKNKMATYTEEKIKLCKNNRRLTAKYTIVENDIQAAEGISELVKEYEIKPLCKPTKLYELKFSKQRIVYFMYDGNVFVFLGTFTKKTRETDKNEIDLNNGRIKMYLESKNGEKE